MTVKEQSYVVVHQEKRHSDTPTFRHLDLKMNTTQKIPLIETAIRASLLAGIEIMQVYQTDFEVQNKSDNSPVTQADIAASCEICKILALTHIPIICEENEVESYTKRKDWKQIWIVDPLDGTKDFIMRNGEFTINIALIENGNPIGGVIYIPALDTLYFGIIGIGAYVISKVSTRIDSYNWDKLCTIANKLPLITQKNNFIIMASRSFLDDKTKSYIQEFANSKPNRKIVQLGSSLKFLEVASGKADLYPRLSHIHEWDIAAGDAIARASGCSVTDFHTKQPITYNSETLESPCFIVQRK